MMMMMMMTVNVSARRRFTANIWFKQLDCFDWR